MSNPTKKLEVIKDIPFNGALTIIDKTTNKIVANMIDNSDQSKANANLWVNSPKLLEVLEEAVVGYEWKKENLPNVWDKADDEHLEKCQNLINKIKDQ